MTTKFKTIELSILFFSSFFFALFGITTTVEANCSPRHSEGCETIANHHVKHHIYWKHNLGDRIRSYREIPEGSFLQSRDGRFKMLVQGDGNLVIYQYHEPIWASNTNGRGTPGFKLVVQSDGNLVMYGRNSPIWASNTNGDGDGYYTLIMQNDGNLVLYDRDDTIWESGTCCR